MEFLNPAALYGFLALPLLIVPYLVRRRPRRVIFSSLLLFSELAARPSGQRWGRLRLPPIFFLQLLLLVLLILALGEPVFSVHPKSAAIILDNSASMQALEDGKTRFALAKEQARAVIGDLGAAAKIDVYLMAPQLEKIPGSPFAAGDAIAAIAALEPYDVAEVAVDYGKLIGGLAAEQSYDRVYLLTDHPGRNSSGNLRVLSVGSAKDNLAIAAFQVTRASLANARLEAKAEVTNFSARDQKIRILLRGGGAVLASRDLAVGAGKSATAGFEGFAPHPYYEAEIDARDALLLDNRQFAVAPAARELRILGISPRPQALTSLRAIPGVTLDVIAPGDYAKSERSGYGLEIFHFAAPAALPRVPALLILPPDNNPLVELGTPLSRPVVSGWREPHPLTRYVNFALFRPSYARPLRPKAAGEAILESSGSPLAFAAEDQGLRHLVLGFDPLPYLGRDNLPVSIFTVNLLDWFFDSPAVKQPATGEPLPLGGARPDAALVTPRGEKVVLKAGAKNIFRTLHQGIYQLTDGGEKQLLAVNFRNSTESNLRESAPIAPPVRETSPAGSSLLFSLWPYLLLASLLLLLIEWFINPRIVRARAGAGLRAPSSP